MLQLEEVRVDDAPQVVAAGGQIHLVDPPVQRLRPNEVELGVLPVAGVVEESLPDRPYRPRNRPKENRNRVRPQSTLVVGPKSPRPPRILFGGFSEDGSGGKQGEVTGRRRR